MKPPEPSESANVIAERLEKENRKLNQQREIDLDRSLDGFRVGSVPYLNAAPLTRGIEDQIILAMPAKLAEMLGHGELDAALVSVTEVIFRDAYDVLDGVAVASLGEVKSVFLAHRKPLEEATEVFCDPASLTSVELLRVLLGERDVRPQFKPLKSYDSTEMPDFALLIGNPAIDFLRAKHQHEIWDLGAAWYELTGLPFVYAVWALRRGVSNGELRTRLREARSFGMDTLDYIISSRNEYDLDFRKDYLGWHIHYHLGSDEKRGLARFMELLRKHSTRPLYAPRYVD